MTSVRRTIIPSVLLALTTTSGLASAKSSCLQENPISPIVEEPAAPTCKGDGGYSCPARNAVNEIVGEGYDPTSVNWDSVVAEIIQIGDHEPRFCNFAIRSWWHDVAGINTDKNMPFDGAADGSFLTDFNETDTTEGALHGFGQFTRHVLLQIAAAHGASHADVLTVAAAKCTTEVLGGTVDIAAHCEAQGLPLYMGKMDYAPNPSYNDFKWAAKAGRPPPTHGRISKFVRWFTKVINPRIEDNLWKLKISEALALMGSHAIMMSHGCTTGADMPKGKAPGIGDRTCGGQGGKQRMFTWDNAFFKDVTAGACTQGRNLGKNSPLEGVRDVGMTKEVFAQHTQCGFGSMEGYQLTEQLECVAMRDSKAKLPSPAHLARVNSLKAFNVGWHNAIWFDSRLSRKHPISERAPCCGFQCQSCEENPESKFWCQGRAKDNRDGKNYMWPYTYMDCDFNKVYNFGADGYCDGEKINAQGQRLTCSDCESGCKKGWNKDMGYPISELKTALHEMESAMEIFRSDRQAWEETYATAFCKLSNFGVTYTPTRARFQELFKRPTQGCLNVRDVLSIKQCSGCDLPQFSPEFQ